MMQETVAAYFQTLGGLPQKTSASCGTWSAFALTSKKPCSIGFQQKPPKTRWSSSTLQDKRRHLSADT